MYKQLVSKSYTLTISHHDQKAHRRPSLIAEEGGNWEKELHRRSTDITCSNLVMWNSWISDFNDDDDSSECVWHVCVCVCVCVVTAQGSFPVVCSVKCIAAWEHQQSTYCSHAQEN